MNKWCTRPEEDSVVSGNLHEPGQLSLTSYSNFVEAVLAEKVDESAVFCFERSPKNPTGTRDRRRDITPYMRRQRLDNIQNTVQVASCFFPR